jgi:predicted ArsR family transcriptional regulator
LAEPAAAPAGRAHGTTMIVLAVLEAGPQAACDIAARAGLSKRTVKDALRRLCAQGIVTAGGSYHRPLYELAAALAADARVPESVASPG